uniref:Sfi1 spindle body domain-containing protein n=1 Tax=Aureoumbra lagunensis TaxID=44058 RepID=A0A6S8BJ54_9STRA|mmetsp:Transcript_4150/g.6342  ORF Transcript_4150/g.6342 Transcript_4150/m.6342 type:complete len:527 (-) Transcript_4150:620-2200(-)
MNIRTRLSLEVQRKHVKQREELEAIFSSVEESDRIANEDAIRQQIFVAFRTYANLVQDSRRLHLWLRLWRGRHEEKVVIRQIVSSNLARAKLWRLCAVQMWTLDIWWRYAKLRRMLRKARLVKCMKAFVRTRERRVSRRALLQKALNFRRRRICHAFFTTIQSAKSQHRAQVVIAFNRRNAVRRAITSWRRKVQKKIKMQQYLTMCTRRRAFGKFKRFTILKRHSKRKLAQAIFYWQQQRFFSSLRLWRHFILNKVSMSRIVNSSLDKYNKKKAINMMLYTILRARRNRELIAEAESRSMARALLRLQRSILCRAKCTTAENHWRRRLLASVFSTLRRRLLVSARLAHALDAIAERSRQARGLRALWLNTIYEPPKLYINPFNKLRMRRAFQAFDRCVVRARLQHHLRCWALRRAQLRTLRHLFTFAKNVFLSKCRLEAALLHHQRKAMRLGFDALHSFRWHGFKMLPTILSSGNIPADELISSNSTQQEDVMKISSKRIDDVINKQNSVPEGTAIFELLKLAADD